MQFPNCKYTLKRQINSHYDTENSKLISHDFLDKDDFASVSSPGHCFISKPLNGYSLWKTETPSSFH